MKAYILHHPSMTERDPLVQALIQATNAEVIEPVWIPENPVRGCRESHKKVLGLNLEEPCLIFEDDCEIVREDFLCLLEEHKECDMIYLGVCDYSKNVVQHPIPLIHSYGTHAYFVNAKARQTLFHNIDKELTRPYQPNQHAIDQLYNVIEFEQKLKVWKPPKSQCRQWVQQKEGLQSSISGVVRSSFSPPPSLYSVDGFERWLASYKEEAKKAMGQGQVL